MTATMISATSFPSLSCPPRFGTQRNPDRPTLGPAVGAVSRKLGKPFMPWQQYVADVVMELDPVTLLLVYDEMGLTIPRQQGKSTWVEAKSAHRCTATKFFGPRQHVVYTAQTRQKAREKWEEDFIPCLEASRDFRARARPHWGNGNEHVRFANGSRWGLEANTEKAGHGSTLDEAHIDEAFAHRDFRLEQAFRPAQITRLNKLLAWISTAGWIDNSEYLREKVDFGGGPPAGYRVFRVVGPGGRRAGRPGDVAGVYAGAGVDDHRGRHPRRVREGAGQREAERVPPGVPQSVGAA